MTHLSRARTYLTPTRSTPQAPEGFMKSGGFSGVYNGVTATALGAAPGAALFFSAYEGMKPKLQALNGGKEHPLQHSCAASCGEVAACLIRVPTAVVTQRMQVGQYTNYPQAMKAPRQCRCMARRAGRGCQCHSGTRPLLAGTDRRVSAAKPGARVGGAAGKHARRIATPLPSHTRRRSTRRRAS